MIGYSPKDTWNEDETGCFFQALPDKTLADAKKACKGGQKAKIRITLAFCRWRKRNANCDRKISLPWCFKGIRDKKMPLGVPYYKSLDGFSDHVGYSQQDQLKACTTEEKSDFISGQCQLTFSRFGW